MQKLIDKRHQKRFLSVAWTAVRAGEKEAMRLYDVNHASAYGYKKNREIVTRADMRVNKTVIRALKKLTPDIPVCSEEGADIGPSKIADAELAWLLDPIDGTTNYAARLPLWGISLALMRRGEPIIGVISLPPLKHRYHAIKGGGAWFGKHRLHVSGTKLLSESVSLLCFGYGDADIRQGLHVIKRVADKVRAMRRLGAAVIESAWIASGRADFTILNGVKPWDVGAGALLVREAGGKAVNLKGGDWTSKDADIVMTAPKLLRSVLKLLD
jgi:myo-inositol-1(or 4)-monophosphatase